MIKTRDISLDYIRLIGIFLIILAHIPDVPSVVMAIRRFDVPLMVIISGYLFSKVQTIEEKNISIYLSKRFKRLVLPVWVFLCIFFTAIVLIVKIIGYRYPFTLEQICRSFFLLDGIGYVWIIRIYLFVALIGPYLYKKMKNGNTIKYLAVAYGAYEIILILFGIIVYSLDNKIFNYLYSKYPPRLFYVFYSIFISNILLGNKEAFLKINNNTIEKIVSFVGNSTMWIYLWHIILIMILQILNKKNIKLNYIISYILVIVFSTLITFFQNKAIKIISVKYENNKLSKNLKMIFLG